MSFQSSPGRILAATVMLSALVAVPDAADAALQARATMSPTTIHYPGTRAITYRLELTTDEPRVVHVSMISPQYTGPPFPKSIDEYIEQLRNQHRRYLLTGERRAVGSPIGPLGRAAVTGAGTRLPAPSLSIPPSLNVYSPYRSCERGYRGSTRQALIRLPARTTTTLIARYRTGRSAPWIDTDYRLAFLIRLPGAKPGPEPRERVVRSPQPDVRGRIEPELRLRTIPPRRASPGRRIAVVGRTEPLVPRRRLRLLFRAGPRESLRLGPTRLMARVRTNAQGRFVYRGWTAAYDLDYEVWAEDTSGRLESCSVVMQVGGRAHFA
ncbi:MAG: hypothetical protein M3141_02030 [Actinomycetota bacterium]|nr:hypothetical protein [Actinomycetota bacterium]